MEQPLKPLSNPFVHYSIIFVILSVGLLTISMHLLMALPTSSAMMGMNMQNPNTQREAGIVIPFNVCKHIGTIHTITISHNAFMPKILTVNRCDRVEFLNEDDALYLPRFGDHPNDITYTGFPQKILGHGQSEVFVAHTSGMYGFHDHLRDQIEGTLVIK